MELKGKKFVVIGGAGLIGSHTAEKLLEHDIAELVIFDNFVRGKHENLQTVLSDPRASIFDVGGDILHGDILQSALEGADGVFHLAALWLLQCHEYPESAFEVNVRGTFNVLQACVKQQVKRLVYSSSASVYGDAVTEPMPEDHPFLNKTFYGATKIASEAMLRAYHHRYGLPYVGLRYMNVYGPRQDDKGAYVSVVTRMLTALDQGQVPQVHGDGTQAFDFVDVRDCAAANVLAMQADTLDTFYNVGTGIKTTVSDLAETICRLHGGKVKPHYVPADRSFVNVRVADIRKASQELGFHHEISLEQGLLDLIQYRKTLKA